MQTRRERARASDAARLACSGLGAVLLLLGFAGFAWPSLFGMHLTNVHNLLHVVSGSAAMCVGLSGAPDAPRRFSLCFGSAYLLLGLLGFTAPGLVATFLGHRSLVNAEAMLPDTLAHLGLGGLFVAFGLRAPAPRTGLGIPETLRH